MYRFTILALGLVVIGFVSGCGTDGPTSLVAPNLTAAPAGKMVSPTGAWIDSSGGVVSCAGVELGIPPGALDVATWVTLTVPDPATGVGFSIDPAGTVLQAEAVIAVPSNGPVRLLGLVPSTGAWEDITVSASPGIVVGRLIHFSRYEIDDAI